jgi:alpha-galactosidase
MISESGGLFRLDTQNTSYWFRVTPFGHLEHIHYGVRLAEQDPQGLALKRTAMYGSSVVYDESDPLYCLDTMALEWSGIGRGDYRHSPAEIKMPDGSFACDFVYLRHRIISGPVPMETLPGAVGESGDCDTLEVTMEDISNQANCALFHGLLADGRDHAPCGAFQPQRQSACDPAAHEHDDGPAGYGLSPYHF